MAALTGMCRLIPASRFVGLSASIATPNLYTKAAAA